MDDNKCLDCGKGEYVWKKVYYRGSMIYRTVCNKCGANT